MQQYIVVIAYKYWNNNKQASQFFLLSCKYKKQNSYFLFSLSLIHSLTSLFMYSWIVCCIKTTIIFSYILYMHYTMNINNNTTKIINSNITIAR